MIAVPTRRRKSRSRRTGFTLIEVIVALGLFALIALAGFSLLRAVLDVQARTDARLQRLSQIQRALFVVGSDLDAVSGRIDGGGQDLVFQKTDASGRPFVVRYGRVGDTLTRTVSGPLGERTQPLLTGVQSVSWSFRLAGLGWAPVSPQAVAPVATVPDTSAVLPPPMRAIALDLTLAGPSRAPVRIRRVVATPEIAP